jgi:hypothetical protein
LAFLAGALATAFLAVGLRARDVAALAFLAGALADAAVLLADFFAADFFARRPVAPSPVKVVFSDAARRGEIETMMRTDGGKAYWAIRASRPNTIRYSRAWKRRPWLHRPRRRAPRRRPRRLDPLSKFQCGLRTLRQLSRAAWPRSNVILCIVVTRRSVY